MANMDNGPTYDELLLENVALREEISRLKQQLGDFCCSPGPPVQTKNVLEKSESIEAAPSRVNKHSKPDEKIELFMQLFAGRDDVYARRFVNKRTGKSGYAPVCGNEWQPGVCEKPKVKCARCLNRKPLPLTRRVIYRHLCGQNPQGEDVVGVYPMLADETCRFLAADFDGADWQEDVLAFKKVCTQHDLDIAIERSRSGAGGHAWFFFEEPISCSLARRLASGLLTAAMEQRHSLSFASYDRLLPNQDTLPSGGFGNLIALPLQGLSRKAGNSEFIDDNFVSYPDQWAYLACVRKIPAAIVEELAQKLGTGGDLGILADIETEVKPWEQRPLAPPLTKNDFPPDICIVRANGVYIPKRICSERALGRIKRLAAFKNPDFYKAQAMRLPTYQKPRVICTAVETDDYICLPRGLESDLLELLEGCGAAVTVENKTETGRQINVSFTGTLRDEQAEAAQALLAHHNGVLSAATAFGKTVTAACLIASLKVNTLILVHTQALMSQWQRSLERFLCIDEPQPEQAKGRGRKKTFSPIGCLGGGKEQLSGTVDVAIIGSLVDDGEAKQLVRNYGLVIADECHHVPALRFETVLREVAAGHVYGLSATPIRQDGRHPIIFQQCGPIRCRVEAREQSMARGFSHILIPRFTRFRKPYIAPENWPITEVYTALAESKTRNELILHDVSQALRQNRTPLVLTERVEHAKLLAAELRKDFPDARIFFLSGQGTAKEKRAKLDVLHRASPDKPLAIVATGKYVGEGFDEPRLDTLFMAMPIAWKGTVSQYAGRLHRLYEGKREVIVYDYVDIHVPVLERMYHKRLSAYAGLGYTVQSAPVDTMQKVGAIFNQISFLPVFTHDMEQAGKEILIVSPYISKGRVNQMRRLFWPALTKGAGVVIFTRPPESFAKNSRQKIAAMLEELRSIDVKVILKERIHQKFAIIDRRIVWYGSMNLLSYGKSEENMMRFENGEIAEELLMDVEKDIAE